MIFNLYSRVKVKVGDEEHIYDATRIMYTEVAEIQKVTGTLYAQWRQDLGDYSITAIAALLHVLRKRQGLPSDFAAMQFNVAELDVIPLHDDDSEFTAAEIEADLKQRMAAAGVAANPTSATAGAVAAETPGRATSTSSRSSRKGSGSGRGNGSGSSGGTSASSRAISTLRPLPGHGTPGDAAAEVGEQIRHDGGDIAAGALGIGS